MAKKIKVILDLDSQGFVKGVAGAEQKTKSLTDRLMTTKNLVVGLFAGAAMRQVISFGQSAFQAYADQAKAEAALVNAMKEKGSYTLEEFSNLKNYASQMQITTNAADENTLAMAANLMQYGIQGDELRRSLTLMIDMVASGRQAEGVVEALGKAYQGNAQSLTRMNAQVAEAVKKNATYSEIMAILEKQFAGRAAAEAQTAPGQIQGMANLIKELKEPVGRGIADAMIEIAKQAGLTTEKLGKMNENLGEIISAETSSRLLDIAAGFSTIAKSLAFIVKLPASGPWNLIQLLRGERGEMYDPFKLPDFSFERGLANRGLAIRDDMPRGGGAPLVGNWYGGTRTENQAKCETPLR